MKRALLILLSVSMIINANAQDNPTRKGRWLGDVEFGFTSADISSTHSSYSNDIEIKNSAFDVGISMEYTIMDNLAIGLEYFIVNSSETQEFPDITGVPGSANTQTTETSGHVIGPAVRYYFLSSNFKPFLGGAAGYSFVSRNYEGQGTVTDASGGGFGYVMKAGFAYFINDAVGFELSYDYFGSSNSLDGSGNSAGFEFDYTEEESIQTSTITAGVIIAL